MFQKYLNFLRGLSVNWIVKTGVVLTTSSFITFVLFQLATMAGIITNAYVGLITYMIFPVLFVLGLLLIPIGWRQYQSERGEPAQKAVEKRFGPEEIKGHAVGSRFFLTIAFFTLLNVVIISVAGVKMLSFMDEAEFCGTACHGVMHPEWIAFQSSAHANLQCVSCHVGEGPKALFDAKLNGVRQMYLAAFNLYRKPVPTPAHGMPAGSEVCVRCHDSDQYRANKLKTVIRYQKDVASTPRYTTLAVKIDKGDGENGGSHWHNSPDNEVRFASVDGKRRTMIWVEVKQPDGSYRTFRNRRLNIPPGDTTEVHIMDCIDCHNRPAHTFEALEHAVDLRLQQGFLDRSIPFIKQEAVAALNNTYPDKESGLSGIVSHMEGYYQRNHPEVTRSRREHLDKAIEVVQAIYDKNVHPAMAVGWGSYPNYLGHEKDGGCFRCHNNQMVDAAGKQIREDCTLCHSILAEDAANPFQFLTPADSTDPNFLMHRYLQEEAENYLLDRTLGESE